MNFYELHKFQDILLAKGSHMRVSHKTASMSLGYASRLPLYFQSKVKILILETFQLLLWFWVVVSEFFEFI